MQKILVVEDDLDIQELLKNFLQEVGYEIILASDGVEALSVFSVSQFDLVLLDVMLPKIDGFAVCEFIRKQSQVPIIMLTALSGEEEQIRGLDLQVDDYITKPFSIKLVLKRVEALLRRTSSDAVSNIIRYKEITLSEIERKVTVSENEVALTHLEFEILLLLLKNKGRVFTRDDLLNLVWGYDFVGDEKGVNFHIMNLRKKLNVDYIETVRGVGYRIAKEN